MGFVLMMATDGTGSNGKMGGRRGGRRERRTVVHGVVSEAPVRPPLPLERKVEATPGRRRCSRCGKPGHNLRTCDSKMGSRLARRPTFDSCDECHGAGVVQCRSCRCTSVYDTEIRREMAKDSSADTILLLGLSRINFALDGLVRSEVCQVCGGTSLMVCRGCRGLLDITG